jgi:hypothetical protein
VAAGAVTVTLPADLLAPYKLQEYNNTSETLADATDMTEKTFLPNIAKVTKLIYWTWRKDAIQLLGATTDRNVIIHYRRLITIPIVSGDPIGILFGELFIGARTAAIAHGSVGNKEAAGLLGEVAETNFKLVVDAQRGQQSPPQVP